MPVVSYDAVILGAGIAGLSVADALIGKGYSCAIIDTNYPGHGASGAPLMLINPATGRRAKRAWRAELCFGHAEKLLKSAQKNDFQSYYENNGVVRPALTQKIATNFKKSITKYNWQNGWVKWFDKEKFSNNFPQFSNHFGGLFIRKGITVDGEKFLTSLSKKLCSLGLETYYNSDYKESYKHGLFQFHTSERKFSAKYLVDATGYHQTKSRHWNFLPLHPIKGQTATFIFDDPINLDHSVSSLGYMAVMSKKPDQITVGSTYEHQFEHLTPDEEGLQYLTNKLNSTFPGLADKSSSVKQWANVRVSVPDKKPVIGAHPGQKNRFIIAALGSKGLLMSRYLADLLTDHIVNNTPIERMISINRFIQD